MPNPPHLPYPFDARITCPVAAAEGQNLNEICKMKAIKYCNLNLMFVFWASQSMMGTSDVRIQKVNLIMDDVMQSACSLHILSF